MPKKNGYYIETNCLQWLNTRITYENASIRVAWQTIRCEYFVALQNGEKYTPNRAIKHRDINKKKFLYLKREGYIKVDTEGCVYIEDVFRNSEKVKNASEEGRKKAKKRWQNYEL